MDAQRVYYVQDPAYDSQYNSEASDMNAGTDITRPWATWQKAFYNARPGDTVYFRGGVWYPEYKASQGYPVTRIDPDAGYGFSGTYGHPICYFVYPPDYEAGNFPVLDCSIASEPETGNNGIGINNATYLKFKGLTVRNVRMLNETHNVSGIGGGSLGTVHFENMTVHNIGGAGMWARGYDTVYFVNCDVYNCCDSLDVSWPGGDGDGIVASSRGEADDTTYLTVIKGCRVWNVSDDGYDIGTTKQVQMDSCWAFNIGHFGDYTGDGNGIKYSYSRIVEDGKRWTRNCISANIRTTGFNEVNLVDDYYGPRMYYYNNTSYKDYYGFGSGPNSNDCGIDPGHVIYRNNIVYGHPTEHQCLFAACDYEIPRYITQDHNTWINGNYHRTVANPDYQLSDDDFISLDIDQLLRRRKSDGSLPDITFMKPAPGSDLIDSGIDVGLPFNGTAPDLGVHENGSLIIMMSAPLEGSEYVKGDHVTMQAEVNGESNSISEVSFYTNGGELLGKGEKIASSIWQFIWESDIVGNQNLRAVAINDNGMTITSNLVTIIIKHPTSSDTSFYNEFTLYPNPNSGEFTLFLEEGLEESSKINVLGMDGRIYHSGTTIEEGEKSKVFSFQSTLAPGVYVLWFANQQVQQSFIEPLRFIVQ